MSDQELLNKRNIEALAAADQHQQQQVHQLMERIAGLQATVAMMTREMQELKQQVAVYIAARGSGRTT